MALAYSLHWLGVVAWVGGMAFAHFALRPSVTALAPPERLTLLSAVLGRFLPLAGVSVVAIVASGGWLLHARGGFANADLALRSMIVIGTVMAFIYGHIAFGSFRRLRKAVVASDWAAAGAATKSIRALIALNLGLGAIVIVAAALHRAG